MGGDYANDGFRIETLVAFQLKALHKNSCFTNCKSCFTFMYKYEREYARIYMNRVCKVFETMPSDVHLSVPLDGFVKNFAT